MFHWLRSRIATQDELWTSKVFTVACSALMFFSLYVALQEPAVESPSGPLAPQQRQGQDEEQQRNGRAPDEQSRSGSVVAIIRTTWQRVFSWDLDSFVSVR